MPQRAADLQFANDDQAAKTVVLDMGREFENQMPTDTEKTVVLDLSPSQVDQMLTDGAPKSKDR